MNKYIDDIDRAILDCLQEDARMQSTEIARRLGSMTARAIRNRLDRLREEEIIAITAAAVPFKLGYPISADIYIDVKLGHIEQVSQSLRDLDEVFYVALTTGDTDISASVVSVSMEALQDFITNKLHTIPGVIRTKTYVLTKILKQSCDWPFPKELPHA
jgi:DNA-binding Lrp family transcriptional regulator